MKLAFLEHRLVQAFKKTDLYETLNHAKNYLSAEVAVRAIAIFSIPIFTRLMTPEDYGIVNVFNGYLAIGTVVLALNAFTSVGRFHYEKDDLSEFIGTTLIFVGAIFLFNVALCTLLSGRILKLMEIPSPLFLICLFVVCGFNIIYKIYYQMMVHQKRSKEFALVSIVKGYGTLALAIPLVWMLHEHRYWGRIWAAAIIGVFLSIFLMRRILRQTKWTFKMSHVHYICVFSFPLIFYDLSQEVLNRFSQIMVNNIVDSAAAGLYSLGFQIGQLLAVVIVAVHNAVVPNFMRFYCAGEYDRIDALYRKVFSLITVAALGLILFAPELVRLLAAEKFHEGLRVVPLIVVGYLFYGMYMVYGLYPQYAKKTYYLPIILIVSSGCSIAINALFMPRYGYVVGAYSTAVAYFVMFLLAWVISRYFVRIRAIPLWVLWRPSLIMFAFVGAFILLGRLGIHPAAFFAMKVIGTVLFMALVFWRELLHGHGTWRAGGQA